MGGWVSGRMNGWWMGHRVRGWVRVGGGGVKWMDQWVDGFGWMDGWMNGWMVGRTQNCVWVWVVG